MAEASSSSVFVAAVEGDVDKVGDAVAFSLSGPGLATAAQLKLAGFIAGGGVAVVVASTFGGGGVEDDFAASLLLLLLGFCPFLFLPLLLLLLLLLLLFFLPLLLFLFLELR